MTNKKRESGFASLEALRDRVPVGATSQTPTPIPKGPARAVVRLERKHRRGKEVTVIDKLGLPTPELDAWCSRLKQSLGCGGVVENETIVLQGDFRNRLTDVLVAMGVRSVVIGS